MTQESTAKKDTQRLQRAIVEGLEDVKAQDIRVFNTEHLSPLFERVIIASGTSNRQTKALAASVRDAVRDAGFGKPRIEGEENGEWIIVDCGAAVAHIMQPAIRTYYHLEDIWGDKPVRLKLGAPKPAAPAPAPAAKAPAKKAPPPSLRRSSAAKTAAKAADDAARSPAAKKKAEAKKAARRAAGAARAPVKAAGKTTSKAAAKTPAKSAPKTATKTPAKAASKAPAKKSSAGTTTRKA
jgi:ribosome-associated protein